MTPSPAYAPFTGGATTARLFGTPRSWTGQRQFRSREIVAAPDTARRLFGTRFGKLFDMADANIVNKLEIMKNQLQKPVNILCICRSSRSFSCPSSLITEILKAPGSIARLTQEDTHVASSSSVDA